MLILFGLEAFLGYWLVYCAIANGGQYAMHPWDALSLSSSSGGPTGTKGPTAPTGPPQQGPGGPGGGGAPPGVRGPVGVGDRVRLVGRDVSRPRP